MESQNGPTGHGVATPKLASTIPGMISEHSTSNN